MPEQTPTRKIRHILSLQVYGGDCDIFLGSLYINIAYVNIDSTVNPDVQGSLQFLGLAKVSEIGLLHVSVGGTSNKHLNAIDFFPNLQARLQIPQLAQIPNSAEISTAWVQTYAGWPPSVSRWLMPSVKKMSTGREALFFHLIKGDNDNCASHR